MMVRSAIAKQGSVQLHRHLAAALINDEVSKPAVGEVMLLC